jgi:hypothetical protein
LVQGAVPEPQKESESVDAAESVAAVVVVVVSASVSVAAMGGSLGPQASRTEDRHSEVRRRLRIGAG